MTRALARTGRVERREVAQGRGSLIRIPGRQHDLRAAAELVEVEPAQGIVLTQDGDQPVPVGVAEARGRAAWGAGRAGRHGYAERTTTAVP